MTYGSALAVPLLDREAAIRQFLRNRQRSALLFDVLDPAVYYTRPIALRHPIVFYEGHLPAFSVITLIRRGLGRPGVDEQLERLFARGIDPASEEAAVAAGAQAWPARAEVRQYAAEADRLVLEALREAPVEQPGHPLLDRAQAVFAILEHEAMHQETLLYMWHQLPHDRKRPPAAGAAPETGGAPPAPSTARIPQGRATLGAEPGALPFGWDNEMPSLVVDVPAFTMDVYNVTNHDYLAFVEAGGYEDPRWWSAADWEWRSAHGVQPPPFWHRGADGRWSWHGLFEDLPLPPAWPVYVSHGEAAAYARWQGARLPTEAEYHRAAFGTPSGAERAFPWGDEPPDATRTNADFGRWDPVPVGSRPAGASAWGVHDLLGNGWEWTSTIFAGFPGFSPLPSYPEYSADFFDGEHYVMKGGSPVTAVELLRRSFRNWFRPHYPYVYAAFRCVRPGADR
jgi:gamma-glutamyl hercynylcysteine S-oxide synthase